MKKYFIYIIFLVFLILILSLFLFIKETFFISTENFTQKSKNDFLLIQNTINRNKVFDFNIMEQQATQSELDFFNKNKFWFWNKETEDLYKEAVSKNVFVRSLPDDSMNYAKTIYNQNAILKLLSHQYKEGQFLINGVQIENPFKHPSGFGSFAENETEKDVIRCNLFTNELERIHKTIQPTTVGTKTINTETITKVEPNMLEKLIPGFSFVNGPCNPCSQISNYNNYNCPFELDVTNQNKYSASNSNGISSVWKYLWKNII